MPEQSVFVRVYIAMTKAILRYNLGREQLISAYSSYNTPSRWDSRVGTQIRNPEAGIEAELWMKTKGTYYLVPHGFLQLPNSGLAPWGRHCTELLWVACPTNHSSR